MAEAEYYETLGVSRDADGATIKTAYRKLAMKFHPDRNPGDAVAEEKFRACAEAYECLKDPQKRAAYDRYGKAAFENGGGGGGRGGFHAGGGDFSDIFDNIFSEFMGGGARRGRQQRSQAIRGGDLRYNMELSLEEAFTGARKEIVIDVAATCDSCAGSGAAPDGRGMFYLPGPRPGTRAAGHVRDRAPLPRLPRCRPGNVKGM